MEFRKGAVSSGRWTVVVRVRFDGDLKRGEKLLAQRKGAGGTAQRCLVEGQKN